MGVKDLWGILSPVQRHVRLEDLRGKTLAVDLSIWVVEVQGMKQLMAVQNSHLRNVFFRAHKLLQLGIIPVFVLEGDPPPLKFETMMKRAYGLAHKSGTAAPKKMGRSHFKSKLRECAEMLRYMGVPCVQSVGEAEAFCALLNKHGLVDACITEDGDAFLYGARTVYRNFTINDKDPSVEIYEMDDIELTLGLTQENLVAMALLLGCDFLPKGVPGVGREMCLKLLNSLPSVNILERMKQWRSLSKADIMNTRLQVKQVTHCDNCHHPGNVMDHTKTGCPLCGTSEDCTFNKSEDSCACHWHSAKLAVNNRSAELSVYRKAMLDPQFPHPQVIKEFLLPKDKLPPGGWSWKQPVIFQMQKYAAGKLDWEEKYTQEKMLPLLTLWTQRQILEKGRNAHQALKPKRIVKCRVQKRVPVYEVEWYKCDGDETTEDLYYTTIEDQELFNACFCYLKEEFTDRCEQEAATKGKGRKKKPSVQENKTTANKENEVPKKTVDNFAEELDDYIPISQLNVKDTLAELGMNHREISNSEKMCLNLKKTASDVDEICHAMSSKMDITVKKYMAKTNARITASSQVVDISSDEDEFLPVSQLTTKKTDVRKQDDDRCKFMKRHSEVKVNEMLKKTTNTTLSESESDDDNLDFLPLSQRVQLNLKKESGKHKNKQQEEATEIAHVKSDHCESVASKAKITSVVDMDRESGKLQLNHIPASNFENGLEVGKTRINTVKDSNTSPYMDRIKCNEVLEAQGGTGADKDTRIQSKSTYSKQVVKSENFGMDLPPPSQANEGSKAVKKLHKKKKLVSNGKKKKKSVNFDALHGDLEMLCMDSILGDITTRNLEHSDAIKEMVNVQHINKCTGLNPDKPIKQAQPKKSCILNRSTRPRVSSKLHELTFSDIEDEIISGAAEIFDEDEVSILPSSSADPTQVEIPNDIKTKTDTITCSAAPRVIPHDLTVWGHGQIGNFDLGLTLDSTVSMANSMIMTDSVANAAVMQQPRNAHCTIYTDSCLSKSYDSLTLMETAVNDNTTMYAGAPSLVDVESTTRSNDTESYCSYYETASETVLEKDTLQCETVSVFQDTTVSYDRNQSRNALKSNLYEETSSHVVGFDEFSSAPDMCTINTPNVTCIEVAQNDSSFVTHVSSSMQCHTTEQSVIAKDVETVLTAMEGLHLEDGSTSNSTFASFSTVFEVNHGAKTAKPLLENVASDESAWENDTLCKSLMSKNNNLYHVEDTLLLNGDCATDRSLVACNDTVVELEDSIQNDSELIPPSPVMLSQRLGAKLHGFQLRTLSIFSQSSQVSKSVSSQDPIDTQFGTSGDHSDVVFVD